MEEDRIATNLGPDEADAASTPKQPKRRFVGKRAAEIAASATARTPNGSIEESTAIQGVKDLPKIYMRNF